jgi:hypothetical protein
MPPGLRAPRARRRRRRPSRSTVSRSARDRQAVWRISSLTVHSGTWPRLHASKVCGISATATLASARCRSARWSETRRARPSCAAMPRPCRRAGTPRAAAAARIEASKSADSLAWAASAAHLSSSSLRIWSIRSLSLRCGSTRGKRVSRASTSEVRSTASSPAAPVRSRLSSADVMVLRTLVVATDSPSPLRSGSCGQSVRDRLRRGSRAPSPPPSAPRPPCSRSTPRRTPPRPSGSGRWARAAPARNPSTPPVRSARRSSRA